MNRRVIRRIILCLFLGGTTTVAVAWGCAIWNRLDPLRAGKWSGGLGLDDLDPGFPVAWTEKTRDFSMLLFSRTELREYGVQIISNGVSEMYPGASTMGADRIFVWHRTGWPMLAFECQGRVEPLLDRELGEWVNVAKWDGGVATPAFLGPVECTPVSSFRGYTPPIPFRPIWRGLIVNVGFWGIAWWTLLVVPGTIRRFSRFRRNRCINCGYSLHHLESARCPECGCVRTASKPERLLSPEKVN